VGALFLIVTATFFASDAIMTSLLDGPDYLTELADNSRLVVASSLLALVEGVAVVGIAVLLYPLLRDHSRRLALGYVSFRIGELAATIVLALTSLMLLSLAQDPNVAAGGAETLGNVLVGTHDWLLPIVYIFSCVAGIMLSAVLYTSRLVPRWLSLLGLVGYPALMLTSILHMLDDADMVNGTAFIGLIPGGLFELVLPIWLFVKGFNPRALTIAEVDHTGRAGARSVTSAARP
jgi:hypothetical protein